MGAKRPGERGLTGRDGERMRFGERVRGKWGQNREQRRLSSMKKRKPRGKAVILV